MRPDQDFEVQPGIETDEEFHAWLDSRHDESILSQDCRTEAAIADAEWHHKRGISVHDGVARMVAAQLSLGVIVYPFELDAYVNRRMELAAERLAAEAFGLRRIA